MTSPTRDAVFWAAATACIGAFMFGYNTGAVAGALIYVEHSFEVSDLRKGALVASVLLGAMLGAAAASTAADKLGRRRAQLLNNLWYLLAAAGMAAAPTFWALAGSRLVSGIGVGMSSSLCNLYISEISPAARRGALSGMVPFTVTMGILSAYLLSFAFSHVPGTWRWMFGFAAVPALLQAAVGSFTMPESPRWLARRGHPERARRALDALFPDDEAAREAEWAAIAAAGDAPPVPGEAAPSAVAPLANKAATPSTPLVAPSPGTPPRPRASACRELLSAQGRLPLLIGVSLNVLQQLSGINVVVYYAPTVLKDAGFGASAAILLTAAVGAAQMAAMFALMRVVDRVGRKPLALAGLVGMIASLLVMAASFSSPVGRGSAAARAMALGGMLCFRITFSLSLGALPFIITAEIFPPRINALGVAVSWAANWVSNFAVSLTFLTLLDALGATVTFALYAGCGFVALIFVVAVLPETAGRALGAAVGGSTDATRRSRRYGAPEPVAPGDKDPAAA